MKKIKALIFKIKTIILFGFNPNLLICEAYKNYLKEKSNAKNNLRSANLFLKEIIIPDKWRSHVYLEYDSVKIMLIHHDNENDKEDNIFKGFNFLCQQCERYAKLNRYFSNSVASLPSIDADSNIFKFKKGRLVVRIVQLQVDKCDIEYKTEIVKVPVLAGLCKEILNNN